MRLLTICTQLVVLSCLWIVPSQAEEAAPFTVGMLLPLSGPVAEMGGAFRRGVQLYLADHPTAAVSFLYEDHKYDGKTTVTALHALHARSDIKLMVVWGNTPAGAAAPVAEQQRIPTLAISMNPDARDRRYVVSLGPPVASLVSAIAEHFKNIGGGHVGAVSIDIGNALEAIDLVDAALDGSMLKKVVSSDEVDFKPIISQLRSRQIDRLVVFLLPQQALTFLRQAKQLTYTPQIVGGDVFAVESFENEAQHLTAKAGFVYGAVKDEFIAHLASGQSGTSYFFEVATGYSVAQMLDDLAQRIRLQAIPSNVLDDLVSLQLANLPIESIKFKHSPEFGRHFEVGVRYYPVPSVIRLPGNLSAHVDE